MGNTTIGITITAKVIATTITTPSHTVTVSAKTDGTAGIHLQRVEVWKEKRFPQEETIGKVYPRRGGN